MAFGLSAGAIGAIGAIGGALIGSNATNSAANTQAQASQGAIAEQARQFDTTRQDMQPWMTAGSNALGTLATGINTPLDMSTVTADPGYQFALNQGQLAIDRKTAAAGGRVSGAALKSAAQYANDYGTTKYEDAYNRANQARSDRLNRLAALAGLGQTSTQQVGQIGASTANSIGNIASAQGNATGAAQLAQGNIWAGAGNQLAALYGRSSGGVNSNYGGGNSGIDPATNLPNYALVN